MAGPSRLWWSLAVAVIVAWAPTSGAAPPCARDDGRVPVTRAGQERDIARLIAPNKVRAPLGGGPEGWSLDGVSLERQVVILRLKGPGQEASLRLRPASCDRTHTPRSPSFLFDIEAQSPEAKAATNVIQAAIQERDTGTFWSLWVEVEPTAEELAAATNADRPSVWSGAFDLPLHRSNTGLALVLILALLALLVDLPGMWRDMGCDRPGCARVTGLLLGLMVAGALARWFADPTFLREAHPLMHIPVGDHVRLLGEPHEPYPQGSQLMFLALRWLLPQNPYDAWLAFDVLLGTLTIPAAYLLGTALGQRRAWGLMAAALLAFWPQHIRISASESVHVAVVFWATLSLATTVVAARSGSVTVAVSAVLSTGALLCTRPEAALWVPGLAVIGLGSGPGLRGALRHPVVLVTIAVIVWLLGPMLLELVGTSQAGRLTPGSDAPEAVGLGSLVDALMVAVRPDGPNALFDARTTPVWLWPLTLWGAVVAWREGRRALVVGLLLTILAVLTVTVHMGASGVIWPMARYHATALPAALALGLFGLWDVLGRVPKLEEVGPRTAGAVGVAVLGCGLWWPALMALPMDWQREHHWLVDLGRREPAVIPAGARIVTPDNRRSFLDMSPRNVVTPLTLGRQHSGSAVPIEVALRSLHVDGDETPAYFYAGLYCHLAVAPDGSEPLNPQCLAMMDAFELRAVEILKITEGTYLEGYVDTRRSGPVELGLYEVGARRLSPERALERLPTPIPKGAPEATFPMGSGARQQLEPPDPPL